MSSMEAPKSLKQCSCGIHLTTHNTTPNGIQQTGPKIPHNLSLHTCNSCKSTVAVKVPKEEVKKSEEEIIEPLEKKCPRCGGASANSSNPSGRCSACLKKLAANKKKPGHWQRAQTKADDALRRQKGKNGTAKKKTSGLGSRKSIVKQMQSAEKKTGEKLSPDRKDNSKGYAASNTRAVPEKLNRGRHHVDEKKLRNWKKKLKKSELDTASLYTLMKSKYQDNPEVLELLKSVGPEGLEQYIDLFDVE